MGQVFHRLHFSFGVGQYAQALVCPFCIPLEWFCLYSAKTGADLPRLRWDPLSPPSPMCGGCEAHIQLPLRSCQWGRCWYSSLTLSFWLNPTDLIIEGESWGGDAIVEEVGGHFKEFTQYFCLGRTLFIHSQLHLKGLVDRAWARLWVS